MQQLPSRWSATDFAWLFLVIVLSSTACLGAGRELGATFDEPFYLEKGLESWRTGSYRPLMRAGTMPLPVDVQTLPLYFLEQRRGTQFQPVREMSDILPIARAMNLPFWWWLLVGSFLLARHYGGVWAGRFAVAFVACEPSLLAHAALATTDIAVTAALLAFANAVVRGRNQPWRRRVLVPGLWYGVALLCKASAVQFAPLILLVLAWPITRSWAGTRPRILDLLQMMGIAAGLLFVYCGSDWRTEPSFVKWADTVDSTEVQSVARNLKIFPNAGEGLVQQVKHNVRGHGCYSIGEWHPRAVWYYFPVLFSQKLTEATLLVLAFALLMRPRKLANPMTGIALLFFAFSLTCRVQIGIRLQFPCLAFLLVGLAVAVAPSTEESRRNRAWIAMGLSLFLALFTAAEQWPNGLRYCNRFWGGAERACERLVDSNGDWGQGLPELKRWAETQGLERLPVWYYGADPAVWNAPFQLVPMNHWPNPTVAELKRTVGPGGLLAVGVSLLNGCPDRRPETLAVIEWLKGRPRRATIGTFAVFEID